MTGLFSFTTVMYGLLLDFLYPFGIFFQNFIALVVVPGIAAPAFGTDFGQCGAFYSVTVAEERLFGFEVVEAGPQRGSTLLVFKAGYPLVAFVPLGHIFGIGDVMLL